MKLSVLITFYNQERFVDQALSGVLAQRVDFDWEILIGDDGSTDGTAAKLEAWRKRHPDLIRYFVRERGPAPPGDERRLYGRGRASANRLALLRRARGQYFTILDGDDFYTDESKFQTQVDILDDPANAGCSACAHNTSFYWDEGPKPRLLHNPAMKAQKFVPERYLALMYFHAHAFMFRNIFQGGTPEIFQRLHFDDQHITFYLLNFGGIYYLPQSMANYRQRPDGLWAPVQRAEECIMNFALRDTGWAILPRYRAAHAYRARSFQAWLHRHRLELDEPGYDHFRAYAERVGAPGLLAWLNYRRGGALLRARTLGRYQLDRLRFKYFEMTRADYFKPGGGVA